MGMAAKSAVDLTDDASDLHDRTVTSFLIIDDEELVLTQLSRILMHAFPEGRVATAANGIDGIHIARTVRMDVIILDVSMPEMDGFQICRNLKANSITANIPVLMISGVKTDSSSKEQAFESGADDYLLKPFSTDDLVFHIKVLLRAKRAEDMLCRQKEQVEVELRRRTQQLYERERMYRELVESLPDTVFEADVDLNLRYMNPAGLAMFGYTARDLADGLSLKRLISLSARQADAHIRRVLDGQPTDAYEYMVVKRDGSRCVARISFAPIMEKHQVRGVRGVLIDISPFKKLQYELLESRESYRALFENIFDAFCLGEIIIDESGGVRDLRLLEVNPAFENMFDKQASDFIGRLFGEVAPEAEPFWMEIFGHVAVTGLTVREERYFGVLGRHIQLSAFRPRPGMVAVIWQDISDRKVAEEQALELREKQAHARHLEAVAALAGNAAHELNNILGPILCYPDLIMTELPPASSSREDLMIIKDSARRAIEVIEDLATFGHSGIVEKTRINLNQAVQDYMRADEVAEVRAKFPGLEFKLELAPDVPQIFFNATHVRRILEAIIYRSYAMGAPEAVVTIATRRAVVDAPVQAYERAVRPGEYAVLEIHDSSLALDRQQVHDMFDLPEQRAAQHLPHARIGLALAHSALKHHGGYVAVRAHEKRGMLFTFYFTPDQRATPAPAPAPLAVGHGETLMVVDDMPAQRHMAQKVLSSMGYNVVTMSDGATALEALGRLPAEGPSGPALVILDMIMPDMDGLETFKRIRALRPRQKCMIVSGYAKSERVREAEALGIRGFVRKPYTQERLAGAISAILGDGNGAFVNV